MAVWQRRPERVIHHSDQGTQYTSIAFGLRCREFGVRPSMGSVGDAYDNALCESFFATLECELLDRKRFQTQAEAKMAVFDFIEGFYNPRRRHSSLGPSLAGQLRTPPCPGGRRVSAPYARFFTPPLHGGSFPLPRARDVVKTSVFTRPRKRDSSNLGLVPKDGVADPDVVTSKRVEGCGAVASDWRRLCN